MRAFIKFIVKTIPRPWLIRFSSIFISIFGIFYRGSNYHCPICDGKFRKMLPYGNKGDNNRLCPKCLSLERHRYLWLYLQNKTDFFSANLKVLHIAPEQPFIKKFRKMKNLDYTTADLVSPLADVKLDVQDIPFSDNTFDVVICNHVMEHVNNDIKAMSEIFRILKPNAWAILQVPINPNLEITHEDWSITSPKEREKIFGQYDHVRFHGKDYPERLKRAGFTVENVNLVEEYGELKSEKHRISREGEDIMQIARKLV